MCRIVTNPGDADLRGDTVSGALLLRGCIGHLATESKGSDS